MSTLAAAATTLAAAATLAATLAVVATFAAALTATHAAAHAVGRVSTIADHRQTAPFRTLALPVCQPHVTAR
eukprot:7385069-Prymnesium_polylepis.2